MRIRVAYLFLVLFLCAVFAAAQEPVKPKLTPTIITATKQVTMFSGLEKQLFQAVQKKDRSAVQAMTTDDFQIEMADADPLAGDDWLDSVADNDFILKSFIIRQMSVVDLGDAAVVKYDRIQHATFKTKDESGEFFVIDLWKKSGDSWKLANRYVAKVGPVPASPKIQPKPTGKE